MLSYANRNAEKTARGALFCLDQRRKKLSLPTLNQIPYEVSLLLKGPGARGHFLTYAFRHALDAFHAPWTRLHTRPSYNTGHPSATSHHQSVKCSTRNGNVSKRSKSKKGGSVISSNTESTIEMEVPPHPEDNADCSPTDGMQHEHDQDANLSRRQMTSKCETVYKRKVRNLKSVLKLGGITAETYEDELKKERAIYLAHRTHVKLHLSLPAELSMESSTPGLNRILSSSSASPDLLAGVATSSATTHQLHVDWTARRKLVQYECRKIANRRAGRMRLLNTRLAEGDITSAQYGAAAAESQTMADNEMAQLQSEELPVTPATTTNPLLLKSTLPRFLKPWRHLFMGILSQHSTATATAEETRTVISPAIIQRCKDAMIRKSGRMHTLNSSLKHGNITKEQFVRCVAHNAELLEFEMKQIAAGKVHIERAVPSPALAPFFAKQRTHLPASGSSTGWDSAPVMGADANAVKTRQGSRLRKKRLNIEQHGFEAASADSQIQGASSRTSASSQYPDEDTTPGSSFLIKSAKVRRGELVVEKRKKRGRPAGKRNKLPRCLATDTSEVAMQQRGWTTSLKQDDEAALEASQIALKVRGGEVLGNQGKERFSREGRDSNYSNCNPHGFREGRDSNCNPHESSGSVTLTANDCLSKGGKPEVSGLSLLSTEAQAVAQKVLSTFCQLQQEVQLIEEALERESSSSLWLAVGGFEGAPCNEAFEARASEPAGDTYIQALRRLNNSYIVGGQEGANSIQAPSDFDDSARGNTTSSTDTNCRPYGMRDTPMGQREVLEQHLMHSREVMRQAQELLHSLGVKTSNMHFYKARSGSESAGLEDMPQSELPLVLLPSDDYCVLPHSGRNVLERKHPGASASAVVVQKPVCDSDEISLGSMNSPEKSQQQGYYGSDVETHGLGDQRVNDEDVVHGGTSSNSMGHSSFEMNSVDFTHLKGAQPHHSQLMRPLLTNGQGVEFEQMLRLTSMNRDFLGP
ncbi:hypothetical protein CEUSTIGMA_g5354.t1 [Chlamydomonas eustigma]|uniref:Uncharacterized protein n=1 Tax=Chlamydomonas eustigma TaxID=1157962 RepID=A0A250X4U7_9CHLO|nr:hypothetical protein CEUSTIGMA_g5354.t1 [Chlamydomonas eustigma]|eukprot:GAX77912.1 hypothetical protein CEUSTIGMA_g5354.t1 [Chlamydomonas eustigma]